MKRISVSFFFIATALVFSLLAVQGFAMAQADEYPEIVATTSWTAAFALAAGAEDVHVLAPYEMRHPPEYEISPSDIAILTNARYVIFAGYEGSVPRIKDAIGTDGPQLVQIATDFGNETLRASIGKIAGLLGTDEVAQKSIDEIAAFFTEWRQELAGFGLDGAKVITHAFHRPLAMALGAEVAGMFGPAPLEARQIVELSRLPVALIVDNYHNDVGKPLRETMSRETVGADKPVPVVEFINFPGVSGTVTLIDVLRENRARLVELLSNRGQSTD